MQGIKWLRRKYEGPPDIGGADAAEGGEAKAGGAGNGAGEEDPNALVLPGDEDGAGEEGGEEAEKVVARQAFHVIQLSFRNWTRTVTNAISMGECVIIENVGEDIDATLDPILSRAIYKKGRSMYVRFGGEEIEYDPKFQLYLLTKLSNPHYKPEIAAQCTLINFVATESGLEEQLLAKMVSKEKPELEKTKADLMDTFNRYKIELLGLENDLLERLANAPEGTRNNLLLLL